MQLQLWITRKQCSHRVRVLEWTRLQERRERHRQNYMHVTIHTSQTWADTFISELNDTHVEAELRTKHIPPQVGSSCWYIWLLMCHCHNTVDLPGYRHCIHMYDTSSAAVSGHVCPCSFPTLREVMAAAKFM